MVTKAQLKASEKYDANKVDHIHIRVPSGTRKMIQECADQNGETMNGMIKRLIEEEIHRVMR